MIWQFTIENRAAVETVIKQPPGWDSDTITVRRDLNWHGVFFDNQNNAFEFYKQAGKMLKAEYDAYGAEGVMFLNIRLKCDHEFILLQRGKFDFTRYEYYCEGCYVKCPIETTSEIMDFKNRFDQKVNLDTLKGFDETTNLPAYTKLGYSQPLPSKGIFLQDQALTAKDSVESFESGLQPVMVASDPYVDTNLTLSQIEFGLPDSQLSEIGSFSLGATHTQNFVSQNGASAFMVLSGQGVLPLHLQCNPFINYSPGSTNFGAITARIKFDIRLKGTLNVQETYIGYATIFLLRLIDRPGYADNGAINITDYDVLAQQVVVASGGCGNQSCMLAPNSGAVAFDFIFNDPAVPFTKGDRYYLFMATTERKEQTQIDNVNGGLKAYKITLTPDSHIKVNDVSHTETTLSKAYMVNEAISRVAEVITNDKLRAYSEHFGRTDSQPYAVGSDGCGSLECITNGLRIRRAENVAANQAALFSISMQDLFTGLNPIHAVGMGVEPDTNRIGYNRLRVEPWDYFYTDDLIMSCLNVSKITRKTYAKSIFSTCKFGYSKWEAEQYNGLDEFLTKREFRTTLSQLKNDFSKLSTMISSGYALEITRRINSNTDTKDWRYDNETFIVCLTRDAKYRVTFDPSVGAYGAIVFNFTGDPNATFGLGIGGPVNVVVAGSTLNNGTFQINGYNYAGSLLTLLVDVSTPVLSEIANGVYFPGAVYAAGSTFVELGNVTNPINIIDPGTIYNYRITPERNAMRWISTIFASYKVFSNNNKIIFTAGDGNYFAKGEMTSATCRLENAEIAENDTIDRTKFDDQDNAKPILAPERVTYDFPMTVKQFTAILAKPTGKIYFEDESCGTSGYGYIDTLIYKPNDGLASFNLIPKIN